MRTVAWTGVAGIPELIGRRRRLPELNIGLLTRPGAAGHSAVAFALEGDINGLSSGSTRA